MSKKDTNLPALPNPTRTHNQPGRKPALNETTAQNIYKDIETGLSFRIAIAKQNIPQRTGYRWLNHGQRYQHQIDTDQTPDPNHDIYWQFWQNVEIARAKARATMMHVVVRAAARGNVTAAIAWLRTQSPDWVEPGYEATQDYELVAPVETATPLDTHDPKQPLDQDAISSLREAMLESGLLNPGEVVEDAVIVDSTDGE